MKRMQRWMLLLMLAPILAMAREIPVADFFRHAEFDQVKLSPTGEFLAVTVPQEDRTLLAVLRTKDKSIVSKWDYGPRMHAYDVTWVNDERFFVRVAEKTGSLDSLVGDPDLYAANADGTRRQKIPLGGTYTLVNLLDDDPRNVLVERTVERPNLFKMDVYTARLSKVAVSPVELGQFAVDHDGNVRYAVGMTKDGRKYRIYKYEGVGDWKQIHEQEVNAASNPDRVPLGFTPDNRKVYMSFSRDGEASGLMLFDPESGKESVLFQDPAADIGRTIWNHDKTEMLGVSVEPGLPVNHYLDPQNQETKLLSGLDKAFSGEAVVVTSRTRDGALLLVQVYSDTDPGSAYLFDTRSGKATFLLSNRHWIKPEEMSPTRPIELKARDGLALHGYLTVPKGSGGKSLPMVLFVHGGPHGPRDEWGFDPTVQFLANRGYAVLQVNYRGSGGYGEKFQSAGYRKWGTAMQDDLTDSVKWAIGQGVADPGRVCIFGGSYGGYAALMSVTREPDLYRCSIGYAGVYSLPIQTHKSDTAKIKAGRTYLSSVYPPTLAEQQQQSPAYNVDKLKVPVMLAHGGKDERVPIEHMRFLIEQMAKVGKKPEVVVVEDKEGHGFYQEAHNIELYTKVQAFLDKHIGKGRAGGN